MNIRSSAHATTATLIIITAYIGAEWYSGLLPRHLFLNIFSHAGQVIPKYATRSQEHAHAHIGKYAAII